MERINGTCNKKLAIVCEAMSTLHLRTAVGPQNDGQRPSVLRRDGQQNRRSDGPWNPFSLVTASTLQEFRLQAAHRHQPSEEGRAGTQHRRLVQDVTFCRD